MDNGSAGLAHKLQATTRSGGLFRSNLPLLVSNPDFWCKAGAGAHFGATPPRVVVCETVINLWPFRYNFLTTAVYDRDITSASGWSPPS